MRAVCQRVSEARVTVDGALTGEIGAGLVVLLGIERKDEPAEARRFARKVAQLRIFEDEGGKFAHSLVDTAGAALVVSQFTLIADSRPEGNSTRLLRRSPERAGRTSLRGVLRGRRGVWRSGPAWRLRGAYAARTRQRGASHDHHRHLVPAENRGSGWWSPRRAPGAPLNRGDRPSRGRHSPRPDSQFVERPYAFSFTAQEHVETERAAPRGARASKLQSYTRPGAA